MKKIINDLLNVRYLILLSISFSFVAGFYGLPVVTEMFANYSANKAEERALTTGDFASREDVRSKWIRILNEKNPQLHDAMLAAMIASKASNKEIFILTNDKNAKMKYKLSLTRGNADNILSYNHKINYISFDHYSDNEGPTLTSVENMICVERKIAVFYKELGIK